MILLMGLGRSAGAITGPISYLAHRYQRWNAETGASSAASVRLNSDGLAIKSGTSKCCRCIGEEGSVWW